MSTGLNRTSCSFTSNQSLFHYFQTLGVSTPADGRDLPDEIHCAVEAEAMTSSTPEPSDHHEFNVADNLPRHPKCVGRHSHPARSVDRHRRMSNGLCRRTLKLGQLCPLRRRGRDVRSNLLESSAPNLNRTSSALSARRTFSNDPESRQIRHMWRVDRLFAISAATL